MHVAGALGYSSGSPETSASVISNPLIVAGALATQDQAVGHTVEPESLQSPVSRTESCWCVVCADQCRFTMGCENVTSHRVCTTRNVASHPLESAGAETRMTLRPSWGFIVVNPNPSRAVVPSGMRSAIDTCVCTSEEPSHSRCSSPRTHVAGAPGNSSGNPAICSGVIEIPFNTVGALWAQDQVAGQLGDPPASQSPATITSKLVVTRAWFHVKRTAGWSGTSSHVERAETNVATQLFWSVGA